MRRLAAALAAAAFAVPSPASADPVIQTCGSDDYRLAYVEAGGHEIAEVCTSFNPFPVISCNYPATIVCELLKNTSG